MPPTNRPEPVPQHHLEALRRRLGLDVPAAEVEFDNKSLVVVQRKIVVHGYLGSVATFHDTGAELARAYVMALKGRWAPVKDFDDDPARWGDDAPF